ncbi:MAG: shikimate kinase [Acidobacteria bacterium]|nr:MAG: shikimate kinase [Acidobacteriota bacterium]
MVAANGASPAPSLVLVGMMYSGKSSCGRELAKRIGGVFFDTDEEVERLAGSGIPEIWEREGESGFRSHEAKAISALRNRGREPVVVATGGGVLTTEGAGCSLREIGSVVYLRATPETLARRARSDVGMSDSGPMEDFSSVGTRPLIQDAINLGPGALERRFEELLLQRSEVYESAADVVVDVDELTTRELAEAILDAVGVARDR